MAAKVLEKLGKEALRAHFVNGSWRKAAISAKNQARLRREALLDGRSVCSLTYLVHVCHVYEVASLRTVCH